MNKTIRSAVRFSTLSLLLLAFCAFLPPRLSRAQSGPILQNPNFDQAFTVREAQEVEVAQGWDYSYMSGDDRWCRAPCYRPGFKPETQIVVSGKSQRWFTTFARHYAAIHQSVNVEAGAWYRFSCQVYAISEPDGQLAVRVGANPWNAGVFDHTMIWGQQQPWGQYRKWHEAEVVFQAWGDRVRVAVGSVPNYPVKNNAAYVDQCQIERVEIGDCPDCPECEDCEDCPPCNGGECDENAIAQAVVDALRDWFESVRWGITD